MKRIKSIAIWTIMIILSVILFVGCQPKPPAPKDYLIDDVCLERGQSITIEDLAIPDGVSLSLKNSNETGVITISKEKISALKTGSVVVVASSGSYQTEFEVHVVGSTRMYNPSITVCVNESIDFNDFSLLNVTPIQELYEIVEGTDCAEIDGSILTVNQLGNITVKGSVPHGKSVEFSITVIPSYTVTANNLSLYVNKRGDITPTINTSRYSEFTYEVISGNDVVQLSNNTVIAKKVGVAKIKVTSKDFPNAFCIVSVNVSYIPYEIIADDTIYVERDFSKTISYSFKSSSDYFESQSKIIKCELIEGEEFFSFNPNTMIVTGNAVGFGKIRIYVEGEEEKIVNVSIIKPTYVVEVAENININEGESGSIGAKLSNSAINKTIEYELISGDSVSIDNKGNIIAIKEGKSVVKCYVHNERYAMTTINVIHATYDVQIPDPILLYVGRNITFTYSIAPQTKNYTIELIENVNDCITFDKVTCTITANEPGTAKIKFTPTYSPEFSKVLEITVEHIPYDISINIQGVEVDFTQTLEFFFTSEHSDFNPNKEFEISIISGAENVKFNAKALTVKGLKVGDVQLLCKVEDGKEKIFTFHVEQRGYVIEATSFVTMKIFDSYQLDAKIIPEGREEVLNYVVSMGDCVTVDDNGVITATKVGIAEVKCYVKNGRYKNVLINVENIDYDINSSDFEMFDSYSADLVYSISPASSKVIVEVVEGGDLIILEENPYRITALVEGEVVLRLYAEVNPQRYIYVNVKINRLVEDAPEGYHKLNDYLYVSHKPGYHTEGFTLKYFTPYNDATIYYTMNKTIANVNSNVFTRSDSIKISANQRGNTLSTTPLMVSVVPHTGGNANSHGSYVNNYYNKNSYPEISIGTVISVIVVRNGETVYSTINTYIAESNKPEYGDYPVIALYMNFSDWMGSGNMPGMYNSYTQDIIKRVNLEYFEDGEGFSVNSQVKIGGGWSVGWPQRTMHLNFSKDENGNKQESIKYEIFGKDIPTEDGEDFLDKFTRFRLHNGGSCYDGANGSANVNDALIHELCKNVTNVSTTEYRPAIVYLNGEYWGYYLMREHYSNDFYKYNYDVPESAVQYVDHRGTPKNNIYSRYYLEDGDVDTFTPFLEEMYTYIGHTSTKTNADGTKTTVQSSSKNFNDSSVYYEFINKYIDVDSFIDYVLIEAYCDNWDCMTNGNNYRMWRVDPTNPKVDPTNPYSDGKLRFSLHDLDMALSPAYNANNRLVSIANASKYISSGQGGSYQVNDLLAALMKSDLFRARLMERLEYIAKTVFDPVKVATKLDEMHAELTPIYADSKVRWCWNLSLAQIRTKMDRIISFFSNRYNWFKSTLEEDFATYQGGIAGGIPESEDENITGVTYVASNYNDGNGSVTDNRVIINKMPDGTAMSMTDFDMTFTSIIGDYQSYGGEQIHMKFIYGSANFVVRVNTGTDTLLVSKIQNGPTVSGMAKLKTGFQKWRVEKRGTVMKIWIDGALVMHFELINTSGVAITQPITQIDFYQHRMNRTIRNFYLKKYA